jgi:dihydroorotate dehydrogenase electron transfer subunit
LPFQLLFIVFYFDKMFCTPRNIRHGTGRIESNTEIAERTFRLVLTAEELPEIQAGQFVMLRLPNRSDPLLGRPLAVYRATRSTLETVYLIAGKMTSRLSELQAGNPLEFWTPLGNGFIKHLAPDTAHLIMVAGGIGQTPFLMLAEKMFEKISSKNVSEKTAEKEQKENKKQKIRQTLLYGAKKINRICCMEDFGQFNTDIHIATDDGSCGYHGLVTDLIRTVYRPGEPSQIFCCGPKPMLKAAFQTARQLNLPCAVSLETPMSCGLGICFGCVIKYRNEPNSKNFDYRRTCVDGPVFDAYRLDWEGKSL